MIEAVMMFLREVININFRTEGFQLLVMLFLWIDFPLVFLIFISYQILRIKDFNIKQLLLSNANLVAISGLYVMLFFLFLIEDSGILRVILYLLTFFFIASSLIFLYLQIFKKHNYMFYNLINFWWGIFCSILMPAYGLLLIYAICFLYFIAFFYKKSPIKFRLSLIFLAGIYFLGFYSVPIFNTLFFLFIFLFPFFAFLFFPYFYSDSISNDNKKKIF